MRVDKWLFFARFFKTRSLAAEVISAGHLRINSRKVGKPARPVGPGDVLTFRQARRIRVVRLLALPERRGSAAEAQALYDDLTEPEDSAAPKPSQKRR
ncbi:RNA-binding S4 domain-containing protein [Frigidibacter sp. SLM-1]|nr:RNA-binding S4 domain-containing protein [Frigidibacter sp. ROC022]MCR8723412.1 RNA-binding S4 domain-containing protein [Frigidibacter sp. ROC022]